VEVEPLCGGALLVLFFTVDLLYFGEPAQGPRGGWFPLLIGAIAFTLLTTWAKGRKLMIDRMNEASLPMEMFIKSAATSAARVPGTAVFMTSSMPAACRTRCCTTSSTTRCSTSASCC
jgi:KUP system potassium uptake protein